MEERKRIVDDPEGAAARTHRFASASKAAASQVASPGKNDMVEKEAKRLEVMKRRQERELGQMVSFEVMRKAMQVSVISNLSAELHQGVLRLCGSHLHVL